MFLICFPNCSMDGYGAGDDYNYDDWVEVKGVAEKDELKVLSALEAEAIKLAGGTIDDVEKGRGRYVRPWWQFSLDLKPKAREQDPDHRSDETILFYLKTLLSNANIQAELAISDHRSYGAQDGYIFFGDYFL